MTRALRWCKAQLDGSPAPPKWTEEPSRSVLARNVIGDAVKLLAKSGRFDEADRMAERGLGTFPDDKTLVYQHALIAHRTGRHAAAVVRWERALQLMPDTAMCYAGLAADLRATQDDARAERVLADGLRRFPAEHGLIIEAARLATSRGRFADSLDLWDTVCASGRPHPDWLQGRAQCLIMLDRFEEAEAEIKAARASFPDHGALQGLEELLASAREERPAAPAVKRDPRRRVIDTVTDADRSLPPKEESSQRMPLAGRRRFEADLPGSTDALDDEASKALLQRFESLGETCELALVQRRYRAEPLGLLRWNTVEFDSLVEALGQRLRGMGDEANVGIDVAPTGAYFAYDRRWSLPMHTFQRVGEGSEGALQKRMCRRISYLRDKLLSDLADAQKIFVYCAPALEPDRVEVLHRALRVYGPVTLLAVQPAGASSIQGTAGDIQKIEDRRFVGFTGRAGRTADGTWDIPYDDWLAICRKVVDAA